jgi:glycosidase
MGVLLQAFYQIGANGVPLPPDGGMTTSWWNHLAGQANALRQAGFTAIWLPPLTKGSSGKSSVGYDVFDDYDIGSKRQKNTQETRYGGREELTRCVAMMRANGLDVYADLVENQRSGGTGPGGFTFRYAGANGMEDKGRFPKDAIDFHPTVPEDPDVPGPDFSFGSDLAPINGGNPKGSVAEKLIASADWLTRSLDLQGYRLDDVKGQSSDFLRRFLGSKSMVGKFAVAEYFDTNIGKIQDWLFNKMGGLASAFDFSTRFTLAAMCDSRPFNMATLDHTGLAGQNPFQAVTFVENHDTDRSEPIVQNKILAYAYILTSEGYPCVFYKDYSTDPGCFGLKSEIDNLIWIHEALASGATQQRWKDIDVFAYERMGGPHLLVALNNDPAGPKKIHVDTGFGPNVALHDYTGHGADVRTEGTGAVTLTVPRNLNGQGYVCYSRPNQQAAPAPAARVVTQDIEGAPDLDIRPCMNGETVVAGRIWCAAGSPIKATLTLDRAGWNATSKVDLTLLAPDGTQKAIVSVTAGNPPATTLGTKADTPGFYTFQLSAAGLPKANPEPPYKITVSYTAPQRLEAEKTQLAATINPEQLGQWSKPFDLENVAIHAHLLPTGKILYWGRRKEFGSLVFDTLNDHFCETFVLNPATGVSKPTKNQPALKDGTPVNLFCSGHTFLPDGRLLVVGGHLFDSQGVNQSCIYDPATDTWTPEALMNKGRWYPSAITLPDGGVLVLSGSFATGPEQPPPNRNVVNPTPQVWRGAGWESLTDFDDGLTLFPRFHIEPKNGQVFMSGAQGQSFFLDTKAPGTWTPGPTRDLTLRDYAPSVMYDTGKVLFLGGGLDADTGLPTNGAETIDLTATTPAWHTTSPMHFRRRQHNATILADGTVLVTGGTQGPTFNDVATGGPIHAAELWDPATGTWTVLAEEAVDRCYHATALLLPDGRVFNAGGGEYAPENGVANPTKDTHRDAQLFSPRYLFRGARPTFTGAPDAIFYAQPFDLTIEQPDAIAKVTWIRLGSVTHSFDQNQRMNTLAFKKGQQTLTVSAPQNANICPPGHYMLFVVDDKGVPSVGHIARITARPAAAAALTQATPVFNEPRPGPLEKDALTLQVAAQPPVTIGITPTCLYGLAGCWGGAKGALRRLTGIKSVLEEANAYTSTASVFLKDDRLPDLDIWRREFANIANASYSLRGIEMTLTGSVERSRGQLMLVGHASRPSVLLGPLEATNKVQWNFATKSNWPLEADEETAYTRLQQKLMGAAGPSSVTVTGTLLKNEHGFLLEVRTFVA